MIIPNFTFVLQAFEELRAVFTTEFAHKAYMLFYRCVDSEIIEQILKNHEHMQELCHDYEQGTKATSLNIGTTSHKILISQSPVLLIVTKLFFLLSKMRISTTHRLSWIAMRQKM